MGTVTSEDDPLALRGQLLRRLALADDELFITMLWSLNALQTGRGVRGREFFRSLPDGADTTGIQGNHAVYPWELETLGNELLSTPKHRFYRIFDARGWGEIAGLVNLLRALEGAEYSSRRDELSILREVGRIGARQFEWQRGFRNIADVYRSAWIYGQGSCSDYFTETHGITVGELVFIGFALLAVFVSQPVLWPASNLQALRSVRITPDKMAKALNRIALPISSLRELALQMRRADGVIAYKPSVLRQFPCVLMGPGRRRLRAPLIDLIASRVSSGLFYDIADGGGALRDEYGRRFESYVFQLLAHELPDLDLRKEWQYHVRGQRMITPDLIGHDRLQAANLIIECKSTRMSIDARYSEDPTGNRGYEEMAKGAAQIWRFVAHSRLGLTGCDISPAAVGLVLGLDDWFVVQHGLIQKVLDRAAVIASSMDSNITADDRCPIAFTSVAEIERTLRTATVPSFLSAIETAASKERQGWMFSMVHQDLTQAKVEPRPYPFAERLAEIFPWWGELLELSEPSSLDPTLPQLDPP